MRNFLAIDLGASSGRALVGSFSDSGLAAHEVHRFENYPVEAAGVLYWDALYLFSQVQKSIRAGIDYTNGNLESVGIDTWGVDFGLLDTNGRLLANPVHYRDKRNEGAMEEVFKTVPREELYYRTGIQFLPFNTLFQLAAMKAGGWTELESAETLLMMPDLLNYFLCREKVSEYTIATTTHFYDPRKKDWNRELLEGLGLNPHILPRIVETGTVLGDVLPGSAAIARGPQVKVAATAGHDTASAVAAVPVVGDVRPGSFAYISSGTWSLMGIENHEPLINKKALEYNFTNEGSASGAFRFLKNISGLWPVQECKRIWEHQEGRAIDYNKLIKEAAEARPFAALIDPDHPWFLRPENMPEAIAEFCEETGQKPPREKREYIRCILESLALKYCEVKEQLEEVTGVSIEVIHVVGGGSQNDLLNAFAADALNLPVLAGPVEATSLGNLSVQAVAAKAVESLSAAQALIARSFRPVRHLPENPATWERPRERFKEVVQRGGQIMERKR